MIQEADDVDGHGVLGPRRLLSRTAPGLLGNGARPGAHARYPRSLLLVCAFAYGAVKLKPFYDPRSSLLGLMLMNGDEGGDHAHRHLLSRLRPGGGGGIGAGAGRARPAPAYGRGASCTLRSRDVLAWLKCHCASSSPRAGARGHGRVATACAVQASRARPAAHLRRGQRPALAKLAQAPATPMATARFLDQYGRMPTSPTPLGVENLLRRDQGRGPTSFGRSCPARPSTRCRKPLPCRRPPPSG